jgi:hypothetical protein
MITKFWEILTWAPPDLYSGEQWQAVSHSLLDLLAEQIALLLSRISGILLSFPLHFLEHAGFLTLYKLILVGSLLFIPTILIYRTIGLVINTHQFKIISRYDLLYSFLRFLIIAAIMDQVPWIFALLCNAANNITQELVANLQLNFIYYSAPEGFTADFAVIVLLIGIFVSGIRLLLYYAVRNATLIWVQPMAKRSKHHRPKIKITNEWIRDFCLHRITERDLKLLQFVADYRLTTSDQLARVFFQANNAQYLCNKRLRILFDLHCINRFFPPTDKGSSRQHTALDIAGKKILGIDRYTLIKKLPITYKHTIHVTEAAIRLTKLGPHTLETNLGGAIADLYYPNHKLAIEVDTGAESRRSLTTKIDRYRLITDIKWLLFISTGPIERIKYFVNLTKSTGCLFRTIGTQWQDLNSATNYILNN